MTCPTPYSPPMVATSKCVVPFFHCAASSLTHLGRIRNEGGRERRHGHWHTVQGWRCTGVREARHKQASETRSKQADINCRPEYWCCMSSLCSVPSSLFDISSSFALGLLWIASRRASFRLSRARRSSLMALDIQGPDSHNRACQSHGELCSGLHIVLKRTAVRCNGNYRWLGF